MPAALPFQVYTPSGIYVAACRDVEDAAAIVALRGDGTEIRRGKLPKNVVWREGAEEQPAGESYDFVAQVVYKRLDSPGFGMVDPRQLPAPARRPSGRSKPRWHSPLKRKD